MIKIKPIIILFLTFFFINTNCICQKRNKSKIKLDKTCFFDTQNRKIVDSLSNKIATVKRQFNYIILIINNKKYFTCNIPFTIKQKQICVTGYILETFDTEKVIATPLKITKATIR